MKFYSYSLIPIVIVATTVVGQSQRNAEAAVISSTPLSLSEEAEAAGIDGTLSVALTVDKFGEVKDVKILAGPSWPCDIKEPKKEIEAVREAVKQNLLSTKFSPATENGKPKSSEIRVKFAVGDAYRDELRKRDRQEAIRNGTIASGKSGVLNGRALKLPAPAYPEMARSQRIHGSVGVGITIDERGDVIRAGIISGHPVFHSAVRNAACSAKFAPTVLDGKLVKVSGTVTYNFQ